MRKRTTLVIAITLLAAACGGPSGGSAATDGGAIAQPAAAANAAAVLVVTPSELSDCTAVVAEVRWDIRGSRPGLTDVEIFAGTEGNLVLFAAGGAEGRAETGPWTVPGAIFEARAKGDGSPLARATVGGPACPAAG